MLNCFSKGSPPKPTEVYNAFWYFAAERQEIFFRRLHGQPPPWTDDPILTTYKFTNAYRASDRVSQYLIRSVIYDSQHSPEELFLRIVLFKIFNRIETWSLLREHLGEIRAEHFPFNLCDSLLTQAMGKGSKIFSAAYIMPSGIRTFRSTRKHSNYLRLLQKMLQDSLPAKIAESRSMEEVYRLLRSYPMIGQFLAFQYAIDLNYSTLTNFSEMDFVAPGPGALDGIQKCFQDMGSFNAVEIINHVADHQEEEFLSRNLRFRALWFRRLQLVDCQNIFCEVSKYARLAYPEVRGATVRSRIKQKYRLNCSLIRPFYPPKWGINDLVAKPIIVNLNSPGI